jgi:hypothetical protein
MFEIKSNYKDSHFFIRRVNLEGTAHTGFSYLHCDGRIINVCEYFESKEAAQKILDKYYPKPEHKWKHGDVFSFETYSDFGTMVYLKHHAKDPTVSYVNKICESYEEVGYYLKNAKFYFNIREKTCLRQK